MNLGDTYRAPLEIKAMPDETTGRFEGYAAVFGGIDAIGDQIAPGAFSQTIAERKATGRPMPMHLNHGLPELGGIRGVGIWHTVSEDDKGLRVEGQIAGLNTDAGRYLYERVKSGAIGGLSIGFKVRRDGVTIHKQPGGPRRTIKSAALSEVSLVDDPCDNFARIDIVKSALAAGELPTLREFEETLREQFGFSRAQATQIAERGFKSLVTPRDEENGGQAAPEVKASLNELRALMARLSL